MINQYNSAGNSITADTDDVRLVKLAAAGNTQAFEFIMRRHNRLLFRTARSILKDEAEAEDVLQDAYMKAWRALSDFRDDAKLSTWLVRIVVNEALGRRRRKNASIIPLDPHVIAPTHREETLDEMADPESQAMSTQMRHLLESHIDALPDSFRTVFVLRAVQELSVEETAAALEIPEATVRSRFFRARGLLREALAREVDVATTDAFAFDGERCNRIVNHVMQRLVAPV